MKAYQCEMDVRCKDHRDRDDWKPTHDGVPMFLAVDMITAETHVESEFPECFVRYRQSDSEWIRSTIGGVTQHRESRITAGKYRFRLYEYGFEHIQYHGALKFARAMFDRIGQPLFIINKED